MPRANQKYVQEVICATLAQGRQKGLVEGVSFSEKQWTIRLKRCPLCVYPFDAPTNFILDVDMSDDEVHVYLNDTQARTQGSIVSTRQRIRMDFSSTQYTLNILRCFMSPDELEMMPESVHLMNKVLNIADKTQHVCACCFDVKGVELCTEEEKEKAQCDNCKANLFVNIDGTCTPCMYFFNFGVANQITALFQSSEFRALRTTGRDDPTGIYASSSSREGIADEPHMFEANRSIWSVAIDRVQPFKNSRHTCVKILLRCEDLPFQERSKSKFVRTLALIPGPNEPSSYDTFLCQLGREFERLRQEGLAIQYRDKETGEWKETVHFPVWRFIMTRAKEREKVLQEKGANSSYPCIWCCQKADCIGKKEKHIMKGIRNSAVYTCLDSGEDQTCSPRMHGGDYMRPTMEQIRLVLDRIDNEQKKEWDKNPESQLEKYTTHGRHAWKGSPQVFNIVPTLHILDSCPVPIYDLLLLNIVRRFVRYVQNGLKKKSANARDTKNWGMKIQISESELEGIEGGIISTCDMKKRYSSITNCLSWKTQGAEAFVRVYSPFVFDSKVSGISVLTPTAEEAWKHLRTFTMYYLGYTSDADEARTSLMTFGGMCEEESGLLMTSQLHTAICRLPQQEERLGRAFHLGDLWMETDIVSTKEKKPSRNIDESLAIRILKREATEKHLIHLNTDMQIDEHRPGPIPQLVNTNVCDAECTSSEGFLYQLKGPGNEVVYKYLSNLANGKGTKDKIKIAMAVGLKNALDQYRQRKGNSKLPNAVMAIFEHKSMLISRQGCTEEVKSSRSKETNRRSNYVEVEFNKERKIAEVLTFFKISRVERTKDTVKRVIDWADKDPLGVCRFAVVHIFKATLQDGVFSVTGSDPESAYEEQFCVIPITDIIGKVFGALYHPHVLENQSRKRPRVETLTSPIAVFKPHEVHKDMFP